MRAAFKHVNVKWTTEELIEYASDVIDEYKAQGLRLSLRQLYYQLVTKNLIANEEKSYKRLGKAVSTGRLAGLLDWGSIEDRGRVAKLHPEWNSIKDIVESALYSFRLPRLEGQDTYVELWVEKEALAGVLEPIAHKFHVVLMVNKGYSSQSAMYQAACRIDSNCRPHDGGSPISRAKILYLGDFDPSGEDMVRDIQDRLDLFLGGFVEDADDLSKSDFEYCDKISPGTQTNTGMWGTVELDVEKIGITMPQIKQYNPPPNPAKRTDSRSKAFIAKHGASSWEVDALPPKVLTELVTGEIEDNLDMEMMQKIIDKEEFDKQRLRYAVSEIIASG